MSDTSLTMTIGANVQEALAGLGLLGGGVKSFAAMAVSAFAAIGIADLAKQSVDAAKKYQTAWEQLKVSVMNNSGATTTHQKATDDLAKAQEALAKFQATEGAAGQKADASAKAKVTSATLSLASAQATLAQAEAAKHQNSATLVADQLRVQDATAKLAAAQKAESAGYQLSATQQMKLADLEKKVSDARKEGVPSVKNATVNWAAYTKEVDAWLAKSQDVNTFTNTDLLQGLGNLTQKTGDNATALKQLQLMADLASVGNGSGGILGLAAASTLLAKVDSGNIGAVARQLPYLKGVTDRAQALQTIAQHVHGEAAAYAKTEAGQEALIAKHFDELKVKIGTDIQPALVAVMSKIDDVLKWFDKLPKSSQDNVLKTVAAVAGFIVVLPVLARVAGAVSTVAGWFTSTGTAAATAEGGVATASSGMLASIGPVVVMVAALAADIAAWIKLMNDPKAQAWIRAGGAAPTTGQTVAPNGKVTLPRGPAVDPGSRYGLTGPSASQVGYAYGGMAYGPSTGHWARLHGTEGIISPRMSIHQAQSVVNRILPGAGGDHSLHIHLGDGNAREQLNDAKPWIDHHLSSLGAPIADW